MKDIVLIIFKVFMFIVQTLTCVFIVAVVRELIYQRKHCLVSDTGIKRACMRIKREMYKRYNEETICDNHDGQLLQEVLKIIEEECPEVKEDRQ